MDGSYQPSPNKNGELVSDGFLEIKNILHDVFMMSLIFANIIMLKEINKERRIERKKGEINKQFQYILPV